MARKVTVSALRQMTEELLNLRASFERYKELETLIKDGLQLLKYSEMNTDRGRVFIATSERVEVPVDLAMSVLGATKADKVIVVKKWVSNEIVKAFVKAGEISEDQRERLLAGAEKTQVASLYVRPLK